MSVKKQETSEHWCIAYRKKDESEFRLVANPKWAWSADPFLVRFRGDIYLFAELFLYKSERSGVLGYCKWMGNGFGKWTVTMDKHWHLSYPNAFVEDDSLYMVPESYQREDISLYVLEEFPNKWKRVRTIVDNAVCVDTTFFRHNEKEYMLTFEPSFKEFGGRLLLYRINGGLIEDSFNCRLIGEISDSMSCSRPAGNIFCSDEGKLIRPAQNCSNGYGCGISLMEIDSVEPTYREHLVREVFPDDVQVIDKPKDIVYTGIHTYNCLGELEVIDLKYSVYDEEEQEARKRIRKVFVEKYV